MPDVELEVKEQACDVANGIIKVLNASGDGSEQWAQVCMLALAIATGKFVDTLASSKANRLILLADIMANTKRVLEATDAAEVMRGQPQ